MNKENRKKYMENFDSLKKRYDSNSKQQNKEKFINEIKKDIDNGCGCGGKK